MAPFAWSGRSDGDGLAHRRFWGVVAEPGSGRPADAALVGFASDEGVRRNRGRVGAADGPAAQEARRFQIAAVRAAGDPDAYPHAGAPWQPLKVYYDRTFTRAKLSAYHEALVKDGRDSPYPEWLERRSDRPEGRVTTRVRCDEWFDVRSRALLAHATQIDPDGMFFALDAREQGEAWPTEEWDLALSAVPLTPDEDDLFAGLGSPEQADALATSGAVTMVIDDVVERKEH